MVVHTYNIHAVLRERRRKGGDRSPSSVVAEPVGGGGREGEGTVVEN